MLKFIHSEWYHIQIGFKFFLVCLSRGKYYQISVKCDNGKERENGLTTKFITVLQWSKTKQPYNTILCMKFTTITQFVYSMWLIVWNNRLVIKIQRNIPSDIVNKQMEGPRRHTSSSSSYSACFRPLMNIGLSYGTPLSH